MFASTHPQEFPPAILSRLQRFDVRRLTVPEISGKLERILAADGREADPEAVALVARLAAGGMRDAESILDQLLASTGGRVEAEAVRELLGLADAETRRRVRDGARRRGRRGRHRPARRLEDRGRDLRVFLDQVVDAIRDRLLAGLTSATGDGGRADRRRRTGLAPSTRRAWVRAASASSSSSRCSTRPPVAASPAQPRAAAPPRPARPDAGHGRRPAARPRSPRSPRTPDDARARTRRPRSRRHRAAGRSPPAAEAPAAEPPAPPKPQPTPTPRPRAEPAALAEPARPGRRPRAPAPRLVRGGRDREQEPAAQAAHRVVPAHRGRGHDRDPRLPRGEGLPARGRRAQARGHRGRHRRVPRPSRSASAASSSNLDLLPPLPDDGDAAHILAEAQRIFAEDIADVREVT